MRSGTTSHRLFPASRVTGAATAKTIVCSSTLCCGWCGPAHHGATCRKSLASGTAYSKAHSTAKCNGQILGVEENLTRSSIAEYLSGARVEFILDPLDIGIGHNREI